MSKCRFFPSYDNYKITSKYGMRTLNGVTKMHNGVDLVAENAKGCSVVDWITAHTAGTVAAAGYDESAGYYVNIEIEKNVIMVYYHMKAGTVEVKKGDKVKQGQIIGYMGSTGHSTGAHLHFGIKANGKWIDPTMYLDKDFDFKEEKTVTIEMTVLKKGAKGEQVKTLQRLLNTLINAALEVDGSFGGATLAAVKKYQEANKLEVDGSVGKATWTSLLK